MHFLLYPFAILYDLVTSIRNRLYDLGYKPTATFDLPVISVGNLAVGGTGKTPMIEYLARLLSSSHNIATLSRGYGRKTRGFRLAGAGESAATIGDEPFQIYKKFDGRFPVAVSEERALGIPMILDASPSTDVILLDDAFQHRKVKPSFTVLLTDYSRPFYSDYVLPAGRLRESRDGAGRADAIVITKAPEHLSDDEMMAIEKEVRKYSQKPVFFSHIRYGLPVVVQANQPFAPRIVLMSGIANHQPFVDYCNSHFEVVRHFVFADHHLYSKDDLRRVVSFAVDNNAVILTTEKDASKLDDPKLSSEIGDSSVFFLPIECEFLKDGEMFDEMVLTIVNGMVAKKS